VTLGLAIGFKILGADSVAPGDQLYAVIFTAVGFKKAD
tara:strand:- start:356 stop:469 length:114 start_codon:yes stop_codon:yes gene_type:complete